MTDKNNAPNRKELQILLYLKYRELLNDRKPALNFQDIGFSVYSQNDEDGILLYIFSLIDTKSKKLVDIGAGNINNGNSSNLLINHGWEGLLIDGDKTKIEKSKKIYHSIPETKQYPPTLVSHRITADNINTILENNGFDGEIDLLCIDIDGIDYWIWKAIHCSRPRVVLVEYQCIWGPEASVTVPYDASFDGGFVGQYGIYSGASLNAFVKLGHDKGYRLVGCNQYGYNAFFIRKDLAPDILPEVTPSSCFKHSFTKWAENEFLELIKKKKWVEV